MLTGRIQQSKPISRRPSGLASAEVKSESCCLQKERTNSLRPGIGSCLVITCLQVYLPACLLLSDSWYGWKEKKDSPQPRLVTSSILPSITLFSSSNPMILFLTLELEYLLITPDKESAPANSYRIQFIIRTAK